jgi:hypothetical protein
MVLRSCPVPRGFIFSVSIPLKVDNDVLKIMRLVDIARYAVLPALAGFVSFG